MVPPELHLTVHPELWPLHTPFRIARTEFHHAQMMRVEISDGTHIGRGEAEPHECDPDIMAEMIDLARSVPTAGLTRAMLQARSLASPVRNAIDCALWDLEAKQSGVPVWQRASLTEPRPLPTLWTIGVDTPEAMARQAAERQGWRALKIKLAGDASDLDLARVAAVRAARPDIDIAIDANAAWTLETLHRNAPRLAELGVALIEQPLPVSSDDALLGYKSPVPLCADESCLDRGSLTGIVGRYACINIKLDKTGGLTEALALADAAAALGIDIMVGCMIGTSLAMAPAHLLGQRARFVDLDAPLLLASDRPDAMRYDEGMIYPPKPALWG